MRSPETPEPSGPNRPVRTRICFHCKQEFVPRTHDIREIYCSDRCLIDHQEELHDHNRNWQQGVPKPGRPRKEKPRG